MLYTISIFEIHTPTQPLAKSESCPRIVPPLLMRQLGSATPCIGASVAEFPDDFSAPDAGPRLVGRCVGGSKIPQKLFLWWSSD